MCRAFGSVIHDGEVAKSLAISVEYLGPSSGFSIRIRRISRVSRFCLTRSKIAPAIMSDGTRSVPRKSADRRLATCMKASFPYSSFLKQQKIQLNLLIHIFETFLWSVV